MRYLSIIAITMLLGACGNKINTLKIAGEKMKQTVTACKETVNAVCPEAEKKDIKSAGSADNGNRGGDAANASLSWDIHMMLW